MIFPAYVAPSPRAVRDVPDKDVITITTETGKPVEAWFRPAPGVSASRPSPVVLSFHGNAEVIDCLDRVPRLFRQLGVSLCTPEYRGYGRAKDAGPPSQEALVADGVRFYDELAKRPDVDPSRIIIHGYSIGGGVAAQVAARRKPAALILESTFTSVADFAWKFAIPPFLTRHPFRTNEVLPTLDVPIFIAHGRGDNHVPVSHGRKLHAIVPSATYVELDCGHLDLPGDMMEPADEAYLAKLREFLNAHHLVEP